ncbi:Serine carboxypeptidase-like 18 [Linum perenne]
MAAAASSHAVVPRLPGLSGQLPFHLETGYVGVGESEQVQLFYYFVKSETNPEKDPVVLWLTGGPGCSALSGLVFEIGPMKFKVVEYDGSLPSLVLNPNSWTQWLIDHPEFISNPVYVGGDSYSGLIVPGVVATMSDRNEKGKTPFINLKVTL